MEDVIDFNGKNDVLYTTEVKHQPFHIVIVHVLLSSVVISDSF